VTSKPVTATLGAFRASIDRFNASQPNRELLDGIRAYNHEMIDQLDSIRALSGALLLDVGASPHGYALERALECGATVYLGVGLDIGEPEYVVSDRGKVGMLLESDAAALGVPDDSFDLALSISTLEHASDVDAVLSEMARVLRPGGFALLMFEPIWSCSYGHHLHHFGECAKLVPAWGHLTMGPEQMRERLGSWPADAPLSVDQAIEWTYHGPALNRLTLRDYRDCLHRCALDVEWIVELKEEGTDPAELARAASVTGMSAAELITKGLSALLKKSGGTKTPPRLAEASAGSSG
jgi:SAM-dependent methyltransferase